MFKFIIAAAISIGVSLGMYAAPAVMHQDIVLKNTFNEPVTQKSIEALMFAIDQSEEPLTVTINTGGGSAYAMKNFELYLKYSGKTYNSYVSLSTASAGALLFVMGEHRSIEPNATVLFHGAHYGTYALTQPTVCKASTFLSTEEGKALLTEAVTQGIGTTIMDNQLDFNTIKKLETTLLVVGMEGLAGVEQTMDSMCTGLTTSNDNQVRVVTAATGYSEEYVRSVMYANFEKDVYFTGIELYNMGIAHQLGR